MDRVDPFLGWKRPTLFVAAYSSEHVFHSKLQDSWIQSRPNLSERIVIDRRVRVSRSETVCDVEGFRANLQFCHFTHAEGSGQCHVERPRLRSNDAIPAHVSESS